MTKIISVVLSVMFGVLLVSLVTNAVTTVSTSIVTGGSINASTTMAVTGLATLYGGATTTSLTFLNGEAITNATNEVFTLDAATTTLTTANNATSTLIVGCIQMYATSTNTAVHMEFHASSTLADSTNGVSAGLVVWKYGPCAV